MPLACELLPVMYAISGVVRDRAQPDLTMRQLCLLMHLADKDKAQSWSVKEAAAALEIHKPAVSRAVERLREFGLVSSKTNPRDRRYVVLIITQKGLAYLGRMSKQAALVPQTKEKNMSKDKLKDAIPSPQPEGETVEWAAWRNTRGAVMLVVSGSAEDHPVPTWTRLGTVRLPLQREREGGEG